MSDREKLTEAEIEALEAVETWMVQHNLNGKWRRDLTNGGAAAVERIVAERVAREREAVLNEYATAFTEQAEAAPAQDTDVWLAAADVLDNAANAVRATTQDGEAT